MRRRQVMKKAAAILLTAAVAAGLTACGSKPSETQSTAAEVKKTEEEKTAAENGKAAEDKGNGEAVTLTMWVESKNETDIKQELDEEFMEENPDIILNKVMKEGDPGNDFYQGVAAGNAPDCVTVSFTLMDKYANAGILTPLNQYFDQWDEKDGFSQSYVDMFTKNGNLYGITSIDANFLLAYNKAVFREAGIENPPATWEEAYETAKKITNPDTQTYGYGVLGSEWTDWFFQYYVWQAGGDLTKRNADGTLELTFTDPAVIEAANYYQKLRRDGVSQPDLTLKFNELIEKFAQGKIAMMPFATDWVSTAASLGAKVDDIGLCPFPAGPSGKSVTTSLGYNWVINAKSSPEKQDAAWRYIAFMSSKESMERTIEASADKGAVDPIHYPRTDVNVSELTDMNPEYQEVLKKIEGTGRLEYEGKDIISPYVDRTVQKILADLNADQEKEFAAASEQAQKEVVDQYNKEVLEKAEK